MANFDTMWDTYRDFRTGMYVTSYLWAALFVAQSAVTALVIRQTAYGTAYDYDQILPVIAVVLGIVGSIAIGRSFTKRGGARGAAARAPGLSVGTPPARRRAARRRVRRALAPAGRRGHGAVRVRVSLRSSSRRDTPIRWPVSRQPGHSPRAKRIASWPKLGPPTRA
ncbi:MAG: hypothetical protein ACRDVP_10190 [Acidimicrobiales bacterium]